MFETTKKKKESKDTAAPFVPDGQPLAGGGVRYKVLCDGGVNPSGVFWTKTVPAGASEDELRAAQKERDEAVAALGLLTVTTVAGALTVTPDEQPPTATA